MKTFLNILLCSLLLSLSVSQAFALAQEDAEAAAEEKYPLYQDGEEVVVVFGVGREPVKTYRGIYHPVGKTQIRIGRDTFKLKDLPERIRARFEPSLNARLRKEEVEHLMATEQSRSGASTKSTSRNPVESSPSQVESLPVAPAVSSDAGGMREKAKEARAAADLAFKRCEELQIRQLCKDIMLDADLAFQHGREAYVSIKVGKDQAFENFKKAEQLCNQAIASGLARLESDAQEAMKNRQWEQARSLAAWAMKIESTKGEELLLRTDHAEADWYWQCAEEAMKKHDWKVARENRKALSKLDQERGRELASLINQTEAEYCYKQVAKGLKNGDTNGIPQQLDRLMEIKGSRARELIIHAIQEYVDLGISRGRWEYGEKYLPKLAEFDFDCAEELFHKWIEELLKAVESLVAQKKFQEAREVARHLSGMFAKQGEDLLREINNVEEDHVYSLALSAQENRNWRTLKKHIDRLSELHSTRINGFKETLRSLNGIVAIECMPGTAVMLYPQSTSLQAAFKRAITARTNYINALNRSKSISAKSSEYVSLEDSRAKVNQIDAAGKRVKETSNAYQNALDLMTQEQSKMKNQAIYANPNLEGMTTLSSIPGGEYTLYAVKQGIAEWVVSFSTYGETISISLQLDNALRTSLDY